MKKHLLAFIAYFVVIIFLLSKPVYAQQNLYINNNYVKFNNNITAFTEWSKTINAKNAQLVYLQFKELPQKEQLQKLNITVEDYIGDNTFAVTLKQAINNAVPNLTAWAFSNPEDKISNYFASLNTNEYCTILVSLAKNADTSLIKETLLHIKANFEAEQLWRSQNKWIINIQPQYLIELAKLSAVLYISPKVADKAINQEAVAMGNAAYAQNIDGLGLTGTGVTVGVGDDTYLDHIDFKDRVNNFNALVNTQHGIHTMGTVGSAGIVNEKYKGFAPNVNLVADFFSRIIANATQLEQDYNMKITNNSYAAVTGNCSYAGTYDATSQYLDQLGNTSPQLLNIFAAGNDGYLQCGQYPQRYGTVVGSYQAAKNTLVVGLITKHYGATNNNGSKGPVKDGRLKPEIVAVGHQLVSTSFNNNYASLNGTSMSCPNVSGAAALLHQRYQQLHANQIPDAALLKTLLMNGATDIGNVGPDYENGFGKLNLGNSIKSLENNWYLTGNINHLASNTHTITVPSNMKQLKIMLYWHDAPASPANAKALVNDLDLSVNTPNNIITFPLILNPDPSNVLDLAVQGADHLNNVEQVVIDNPQAGNYTINISGFNIPSGSQSYTIAYFYKNDDVVINFPVKSSLIETNEQTIIQWDAIDNNGDFNVDYSLDNGNTWTNIGLATAEKRNLLWTPPANVASTLAKIKITRNGNSIISDPFIVLGRPQAILSTEQCPSNITIEWNAIPGNTKYLLFRKIGNDMQLIDSTTALNYTFTGLNMDATHWVAVAAAINGKRGIRSVALSRKPDNGSCIGISHSGDLAIYKINKPRNARALTSIINTATINDSLMLVIKNNDQVIASNYSIHYRINNGTWMQQTFSTPIPVAGQTTVNIPGLNINTFGTYTIDCYVKNLSLTDPIPQNDSISITVKNVDNPALNLSSSLLETFESTISVNSNKDVFAFNNTNNFDFFTTNNLGRIRTYVLSNNTIEGNKSISMDLNSNVVNDPNTASLNSMIGTFNLSNYNTTSDEIRFEFDYRLHGVPMFPTENRVYVRGNDAAPWIPLAIYDTMDIGNIKKYGAVSIRDILNANSQIYSTSTQIKIDQRDVSLISSNNFGAGITIDNFKLFKAENDLALIKVNNISKFNCGLGSAVPLSVDVANTMPFNLSNIAIFYQLDNQTVVTETIPSIAAKDTINFTFNQTMDLTAPGAHIVNIWLDFTGDNYAQNDSLNKIEIHNQPTIQSFPYLENFENNNGYFFSDGKYDSWQWGSPSAININKAASGNKCWKTGLTGTYNPNEKSYLYSPCFNTMNLSNPMLSFSYFIEMEDWDANNNEVYDSAYMEYTIDGGNTWSKLGAINDGYNWYNHSNNSWVGTEQNYWQVSSIALPKANSVSLRWVLESDQGAEFAGLAIDDIHVFDYVKPIFDNDSLPIAINQNINGTATEFLNNNSITATIDPLGQNMGSVTLQSYKHTNYISPDSQQMYLPRNFGIKTNTMTVADSFINKLYVKDSLMKVIRASTLCNSCTSHPQSVYELGVTTYQDAIANTINSTLLDDSSGTFSFIPSTKVIWIPYFDGYYASFKTDQVGEYWFNDGGITKMNPLPLNTLDFIAVKEGERAAKITWKNTLDNKVLNYQLQANEGQGFVSLSNFSSINDETHLYSYIHNPNLAAQPFVLYRLRYTNHDGGIFYSPIRKLVWTNLPTSFEVYPNPTNDGNINFRWYNNGEVGFEWALYSVAGQKITTGYVDQNRFSGTETISISKFSNVAGTYLLKLKFKEKTQIYKIIYQPN